jgi:hypothetical protein
MMGHFGCGELLGGLNISNDQKRSSQPAFPPYSRKLLHVHHASRSPPRTHRNESFVTGPVAAIAERASRQRAPDGSGAAALAMFLFAVISSFRVLERLGLRLLRGRERERTVIRRLIELSVRSRQLAKLTRG